MRDASLIHHVRVPAREVHNHDPGSQEQIENVLNNRALLPNVVSAEAPKVRSLASRLDGVMCAPKLRPERHHHGDQIPLDGDVWNVEYVRSKGELFLRRFGGNKVRFGRIFSVEKTVELIECRQILVSDAAKHRQDVAGVILVTPTQAAKPPCVSTDDVRMPG